MCSFQFSRVARRRRLEILQFRIDRVTKLSEHFEKDYEKELKEVTTDNKLKLKSACNWHGARDSSRGSRGGSWQEFQ